MLLKKSILFFFCIYLLASQSTLQQQQQAQNLQYLKLTMYITHDCKYCYFVAEQLHTLIADNVWEVIVEYEEIDCNQNIGLCKDDLLKPVMMIYERKEDGSVGKKLGQLGGTRSKIEIKDWVEGFFDVYAPRIQQFSVEELIDKYEVERVTNPRQALKRYQALTKIQAIKQAKRFNILNRISTSNDNHQINSQLSHGNLTHRNTSFLTAQQIKYLAILGVVVMSIMYLINKSTNKPSNRVRIPNEEEYND